MAQRAKFEQIPAYGGKRTETIPSTNVVSGTQGLEAFAKGAFALGERMSEHVAQQVASESALVGTRAGRDPAFTPRRDNTIAAEAYNKAAISVFSSDLEIKAREQIDTLSEKHAGDPAALSEALNTYRAGVVKSLDSSMPEMVQPFNELFDRNSRPLVRGAAAKQREVLASENQAKFLQYADSAINGAQRIARSVDLDPGATADLAMERQRFIDRMIANGPASGFEFSGQKLGADATRPGALAPEKMAELLNKYDDSIYTQTVMGRFDRAPDKKRFLTAFETSEKGNKKSPLSIEQVDKISTDMRAVISRDQTEVRFRVASQEEDQKAMYLANVEPPRPLTRGEFQAAYGTEQGDRRFQDMQVYRGLGRNIARVAGMSPAEQMQLLDNVKPQPGEGFATREQARSVLARSIEHVNTERAKDPIAFAAQQKLAVIQPLDFMKPDGFRAELQSRAPVAKQMAARFGTEFNLLSKSEAKSLAGLMEALPAQQAGSLLRDIRTGTPDMPSYISVMRQVAPDNPVAALAGVYSGHDRLLASDLMLRGQSILHPVRKEDGNPDKGKLWPMPTDTDLRTGFADYERDAYAGHPQTRDNIYQASLAIYAARSADSGDASGALDSKRWKEAISLASGGIERWNGRSLVMPYGMERSAFKDELYRRIDGLKTSGGLADGVNVDKLRDLPLEPIGDGRYVFRQADSVLVNRAGRPVVIDFNPVEFAAEDFASIGQTVGAAKSVLGARP